MIQVILRRLLSVAGAILPTTATSAAVDWVGSVHTESNATASARPYIYWSPSNPIATLPMQSGLRSFAVSPSGDAYMLASSGQGYYPDPAAARREHLE